MQHRINNPLNYVYLTSVEHSGSTLISFLLGAHPKISTVGEFATDFPKNALCSCNEKYERCSFWADWAARAQTENIYFDVGNLGINMKPEHGKGFFEDLFYYQFPWKVLDAIRELIFLFNANRRRKAFHAVDRSLRLARILCEKEGTNTFLDTTKNPLQIRFLSRHPGINLKVIALVRDGRAVMNSLLIKEKIYTPESAIAAWLYGNRNLERAVSHYISPQDVFRLRLEDLCNDPDVTLKSLFRFLNVDHNVKLDFSDRSRFHIVGNYMRHTFNGEVRRPDESWKRQLSPENLALFYAKASKINKKYGYIS